MKKFNESFKKFYKAQGAFEFVVVFCILFSLFLMVVDLGLFFRQIYMAQTSSDEILTRLYDQKQCSLNLDKTNTIIGSVLSTYYGQLPHFSHSQDGETHVFSDPYFTIGVTCRNSITPDSVSLHYLYHGILFFSNGRSINANPSVNTSFF